MECRSESGSFGRCGVSRGGGGGGGEGRGAVGGGGVGGGAGGNGGGLRAASELPPSGGGGAREVPAAQAVVEGGEILGAGRPLGVVGAPPLGDPPVGVCEVAAGMVLGCRLHRRPPQQPR